MLMLKKPWEKVPSGGGPLLGGGAGFPLAPCFGGPDERPRPPGWLLSGEKFSIVALSHGNPPCSSQRPQVRADLRL